MNRPDLGRRDFDRRDTDRGEFRSDRDGRDWRDDAFGDNRFRDDRFDRNFSARDREDWRRSADRIRDDWRGWDRRDLPFRYGWWDNYRGSWPVYSPYRYSRWRDQPYYWWGGTPAARLGTWLAFNWIRPNYWGYGAGGNIYYRDNYVYYDDRRVMAADDYYQYVHGIAHNVPSVDAEVAQDMDWTPLGVYAVTREGETDSHRVLQLAVNKEGVISGTYYNRENDHIHPVLGRVDERTQRAAWAFTDGEHDQIVFETSLYNLTNSEASMMVHFGSASDDAEVWQLVRLEPPEAEAAVSANRPSSRALP